MRVISGYLKGRNIDGYDTIGTRPTMNRVKESMFASIQYLIYFLVVEALELKLYLWELRSVILLIMVGKY